MRQNLTKLPKLALSKQLFYILYVYSLYSLSQVFSQVPELVFIWNIFPRYLKCPISCTLSGIEEWIVHRDYFKAARVGLGESCFLSTCLASTRSRVWSPSNACNVGPHAPCWLETELVAQAWIPPSGEALAGGSLWIQAV